MLCLDQKTLNGSKYYYITKDKIKDYSSINHDGVIFIMYIQMVWFQTEHISTKILTYHVTYFEDMNFNHNLVFIGNSVTF